MSLLLMGVGVPGTGKSTILQPAAEELGIGYISVDDIQAELHALGRDKESAWHIALRQIKQTIYTNNDVIFDTTNGTRQSRQRLFRFLEREHLTPTVIACRFDVTLETALERNRERCIHISERIIRQYHEELTSDPPSVYEGFAAIIRINTNGNMEIEREQSEFKTEVQQIKRQF